MLRFPKQKDHPDIKIEPLPVYVGDTEGQGGDKMKVLVMCFEVTEEDLMQMAISKRLFITVLGGQTAPIIPHVENPFIPEEIIKKPTPEETKNVLQFPKKD